MKIYKTEAAAFRAADYAVHRLSGKGIKASIRVLPQSGGYKVMILERGKTPYYLQEAKRNPRRRVTKRARPGRRVTAPRKTYRSAKKHTRKATTRKAQDQWQHVYETARKEKFSEGDAIRIANGVTKKRVAKRSAERVKQNPLKRAAKRSTAFGHRKSEHAIEAVRVGPGKRVSFFYFTGETLHSEKGKAKRYPHAKAAHDAAKSIINSMPDGIKGLRVVKI